ncbi:hypothetical protein C8J57DRAFT_1342885 [Mycena rebaudengoi]|nr:hypothetical protein C8J57DRAFT_1342885 [Mycena rebaudengoi]
MSWSQKRLFLAEWMKPDICTPLNRTFRSGLSNGVSTVQSSSFTYIQFNYRVDSRAIPILIQTLRDQTMASFLVSTDALACQEGTSFLISTEVPGTSARGGLGSQRGTSSLVSTEVPGTSARGGLGSQRATSSLVSTEVPGASARGGLGSQRTTSSLMSTGTPGRSTGTADTMTKSAKARIAVNLEFNIFLKLRMKRESKLRVA